MGAAVVWFGSVDMPGGKTTLNAIRGMGRLNMLVIPGKGVRPSELADWVARRGFGTLNVAGNRESKAPGVGARVERFMAEVFRRLGYGWAGV
jgi:Circularly permutated YpsA SLOG family